MAHPCVSHAVFISWIGPHAHAWRLCSYSGVTQIGLDHAMLPSSCRTLM
jgi:hypothetical protein